MKAPGDDDVGFSTNCDWLVNSLGGLYQLRMLSNDVSVGENVQQAITMCMLRSEDAQSPGRVVLLTLPKHSFPYRRMLK